MDRLLRNTSMDMLRSSSPSIDRTPPREPQRERQPVTPPPRREIHPPTPTPPSGAPILTIILDNCIVVDPDRPEVSMDKTQSVIVIRGQRIIHVGRNLKDAPPITEPFQHIDCKGGYVVPGLCDAHVHVTAVIANLHDLASMPVSLITARAVQVLEAMLMRGFTTVRDGGGCDWGLAKAVDEGTILGPRILFCGHALSQTGGHGDFRDRGEGNRAGCGCCGSNSTLGRICDGVAAVREAARDELRKGADHIKIMASGGVASPSDHLTNLQFSMEEIRAAVEEASNAGTYVMAHGYTPPAIKRALECGVRSIEHANMLDEECCDMMVERGAFVVPTLITYERMMKEGLEAGMHHDTISKLGDLLGQGMQALQLADRKGVKICFGSDLLGMMHRYQLQEVALRSKVQSSAAILKSMTTTCAQLFCMEGEIGVIAKGAYADLLVLEQNPMDDVSLLLDPSNFKIIIKEGRVVKRPRTIQILNSP